MSHEIYICYLCAYKGKLQEFRMKKAGGGYSRKRFACPDCLQIVKRRSLFMDITPFEWGALIYSMIRVFNRRGEKFYDRVSFSKLKDRLYHMGINEEFWNGFYTAKEDWTQTERGSFIDKIYMPPSTQSKLG
jgi:hypothetical protein